MANRFVHSRTYIFLYLGMAALSVTTVVLSLTDDCPGLAFYILEIIINTAMILEVGIRFVALGKVDCHYSELAMVSLLTLTLCEFYVAILEVAIQYSGSNSYYILCPHATRPGVRKMRRR